jgi:HD-like signal output (HDOD) protein
MQCSRCAATISDDSRFCNLCGNSVSPLLSIEPESSPVDSAEKEPSAPASDSPMEKKEQESLSQTVKKEQNSPPQVEKKGQESLTRAERVQLCLDKISRSKDLPAFTNNVQNLINMLGNDDISLRRLTNTVLSDYSLSSSVMRTANSFYYNRSGKSIRSVTHAIAMMGEDAIRHTASSVQFIEYYIKKSDRLTELLLLSSLTASHTRHLAKKFFSNRVEEASLCGMLRNLGEILIACYWPKEYVKILAKMKERTEGSSDACVSVMGFSYEELGCAAAKYWKFPQSVVDAMDEPLGEKSKKLSLNALISFSHDLTNAVYRGDPKTASDRTKALLEKYRFSLHLDQRRAGEMLEMGIKDTKDTFNTIRVPIDNLRLARQIDLALDRVAKDELKQAAESPQVRSKAISLIQQLANELESSIASDQNVNMNQVILETLEAIFRGGPFDRVLICFVTPDRKVIRGRLGLGNEIDRVTNLVCMQLDDASEPLIKVLISEKDLFVPQGKIHPFRGSRIVSALNPACFGLFPIIVEDILIGAIYFDRIEPGPPISEATLRVIARLRQVTSHAIDCSRKMNSSAGASSKRAS